MKKHLKYQLAKIESKLAGIELYFPDRQGVYVPINSPSAKENDPTNPPIEKTLDKKNEPDTKIITDHEGKTKTIIDSICITYLE